MRHSLLPRLNKLGRILHIRLFSSDLETLAQGGWILIATVFTGILNYLSNIFVGRTLGPAKYSIFSVMVSLSVIMLVLSGVAQTVITNHVATLKSREAMNEINSLLTYLFRRLLFLGIAGTVVLLFLSGPLATFLQLPSIVPIVLMSLFFIPTALLTVIFGAQRGLQRFGALGWTQISLACFRLVAVVGLITIGMGEIGAVASLPLAGLGACGLGVLFLTDVIHQRGIDTNFRVEKVFRYTVNVMLALVSFAFLINADVLWVKSRFSPTETGLYSAISVIGKTIFWLSGSVVVLLLPKAASQHAVGNTATGLLRKSMMVVGLLCGCGTIVFFLFSRPIVKILYGELYLKNASLLGWYGLAMALFSLVNVWLVYYLAMQEKRYAYVLLLGVLFWGISFYFYISNIYQVIIILIIDSFILLLSGGFLFLFRHRWDKYGCRRTCHNEF